MKNLMSGIMRNILLLHIQDGGGHSPHSTHGEEVNEGIQGGQSMFLLPKFVYINSESYVVINNHL